MKPIDVTSDSYAEYNEDSNEKNSKLKDDDRVRISKQKNIFPKGYTQIFPEEVFIITEIKNRVPWKYGFSYLNGEKFTGRFYEK